MSSTLTTRSSQCALMEYFHQFLFEGFPYRVGQSFPRFFTSLWCVENLNQVRALLKMVDLGVGSVLDFFHTSHKFIWHIYEL